MPEHRKARWWRMHVAGLSINQLAEHTGYGPRAIYLMENGITSTGKRIPAWVWQRYKLCCEAVHYRLRGVTSFDWGQ